MASSASLEALRQKRDEVLARPFPLTADLPDEFDDLLATWAELRDLAMPAANTILEGGVLRPSDLEFPGPTRVNRRLGALAKRHPDIADAYVACFRTVEGLVAAIREAARNPSPKG